MQASFKKFQVALSSCNANIPTWQWLSWALFVQKIGLVDSTVSGVTANTSIANRMLLPRISDVLQASRHLVVFTPKLIDASRLTRLIKDFMFFFGSGHSVSCKWLFSVTRCWPYGPQYVDDL